MSFIPPASGDSDGEGPEMIQANDQIKRVVDESCEIVKEVEKLRLKLRTKLRKSQQLKYKLAGRRNGLKIMRGKVADHALVGEQINKLSIGQLENRLDRSVQRLNRLIAETGEKKVVINEERTLRLECLRILDESVESIKLTQKQVEKSRRDAARSRQKVKEAKESAKALKKQLEEQLKHYEQLEMNARRIVAEAKATELQDQAAELVSLELSKKNEARLQSSNYQTAKAVTHQAEMAGNMAAESSIAARVERQEHGHEVDTLRGKTLSRTQADDTTAIVREMEHASEISLAGKNFGGLSVEHEVSIFPDQSIHSGLTRMQPSRTYSREK